MHYITLHVKCFKYLKFQSHGRKCCAWYLRRSCFSNSFQHAEFKNVFIWTCSRMNLKTSLWYMPIWSLSSLCHQTHLFVILWIISICLTRGIRLKQNIRYRLDLKLKCKIKRVWSTESRKKRLPGWSLNSSLEQLEVCKMLKNVNIKHHKRTVAILC